MRTIWRFLLAVAMAFLVLAGSAAAQVTAKRDPAATPRLGFPSHWAGHTGPLTKQRNLAPALPNSYMKLPLGFEKNQGQVAPEVKFLARGPGYTIFLTPAEAVLSLHAKNQMSLMSAATGDPQGTEPANAEAVLRIRLRGTNPVARAMGEDELPGKANYFIGNDSRKWRTNISTYGEVEVKDIYPGVDLVYYGNQRQLEYDYLVAPGADPNRIRLDVEGARKLQLDTRGDLVMQTAAGEVRLKKPVMYQYGWKVENDDPPYERLAARKYVDGHFKIHGKNEVVFVAGEYDHNKLLTIDPVLGYSTFLGGSANDAGVAIAVDATGNAYVTGGTVSLDFRVTSGAGGWQDGYGGAAANCADTTKLACGDAFITEINSDGTALVYSAYLGGSDADIGNAIALDSSGNAYVAGTTRSSNFPALNSIQSFGGGTCHQGARPCSDAFLAKIAPGGASLIYSTFIGGGKDDYALGLALDSAGDAFLSGGTDSSNFPTTTNAVSQILDNSDGGTATNCIGGGGGAVPCQDGFVVKISEQGGVPVETYGTYLGGADEDIGIGVAVDSIGDIYVVGTTDSSTFPGIFVGGGLQSAYGGGTPPNCVAQFICGDGFVTELFPESTATLIVFSTYVGGSGDDAATAVTLDSVNDVFVAGVTDSTNFPVTPNAIQATFGGGSTSCANRLFTCGDAFVSVIYKGGTGFYTTTYLGGSGDDGVWKGAAIDAFGDFYVAGTTNSPNFPISNAIQANYGGGSPNCDASNDPCGDGFVTEYNGGVNGYVYSTYLGGSGDDGVAGLTLDNIGDVFVTGYTASPNFPTTTGAFSTSCGTDGNCNGQGDAFVTEVGVPGFNGPYKAGQVYVSGANGGVYVFQPDGTLLGAMNTGQAVDTGMVFDQAGNLYVTTFNGLSVGNPPVGIVKFDQNAKLVGSFGNFPPADDSTAFPESILFNLAGDALVGAATFGYSCVPPPQIIPAFEFNPSGILLNTFNVTVECRGTDWVELLPDQQTLLYTSEGNYVKSFNIVTQVQNADFNANNPLPGGTAFAFRVLPNGNLLVADTSYVVELDPNGNTIQTYTPNPAPSVLFALNLDPDGISFWTADGINGNVFKFNIANGMQETMFTSPSGFAAGLAVFGEKTVGTNNVIVTENGSGTGTVTSSPAGINCPTVCLAPFTDNSSVTITATAGTGSSFGGFGANCAPVNSTTCTVALGTADVNVTATFNTGTTFALTVTKAGSGPGTVTSTPSGINCGTGCTANFNSGTQVTLTAAAGSGSSFAGWSGACSGTSTCIVTMNAAESVTATFNTTTTFALTVTPAGTGGGTVTSSPSGILCPSTCSTNFASGSQVTLSETPDSGSTFVGWSGACTGTGACSVTMTAAESVTATFNTTANPTLTVVLNGTGNGSVTFTSSTSYMCSDTTGVVTGTCSASFPSGTVVNMSEIPGTGSVFGGWSGGGCSGTGTTCNVTLTTNTTVTATFNKPTFAVTVSASGTGTGTVTSSPAGITCPSTCTANFTSGATLTLTPVAAAGSVFAGWSDELCAASGTGPCTFTVSSLTTTTIVPMFNKANYTLTVSLAGTGAGTVTSKPTGINCGSGCSASFTGGTMVTLFETPGTGSVFAGWSGACSGTGSCFVTMNAAETVTATFNLPPPSFTLTVSDDQAGTGTGTVTSNPAGITCPDACTASYVSGTMVTLTATPASGSAFAGWSGACTGTSTACTVTMTAAESVVATFNTSTFTFGPGPGYSTTVSTSPGGNIVVGFTVSSTTPGTVTLGCTSSAPQFLSCLITPTELTMSGTGPSQVAIVLTSYCQGNVPGVPDGPAPGMPGGVVGVMLLGMAMCGVAFAYRGRRRMALSFALLMFAAVGGAACGNLPKGTAGATPPGTYTLTISATMAGQAPQLVQINVNVH